MEQRGHREEESFYLYEGGGGERGEREGGEGGGEREGGEGGGRGRGREGGGGGMRPGRERGK